MRDEPEGPTAHPGAIVLEEPSAGRPVYHGRCVVLDDPVGDQVHKRDLIAVRRQVFDVGEQQDVAAGVAKVRARRTAFQPSITVAVVVAFGGERVELQLDGLFAIVTRR